MTAAASKEGTAARAHRAAVQITPTDLVSALSEKLGSKIVAYIADKNVSTINRWKDAERTPDEAALQPLRTAYQVFDLLETEESDHTIRAWFIGMNPQLDDTSPLEALAAGRFREVLVAARAFHAGG